MNERIILVTGANRGLGWQTALELSRQGHLVYWGARTLPKAQEALEKARPLFNGKNKVHPLEVDVSSPASCQKAVQHILEKNLRLDVLVNNAGVFLDTHEATQPLATSLENLEKTLRTNLMGPYTLCQLVLPHMRKQGYGRIVNVSSGMGGLTEMGGGYPAYRISKTALNALTRLLSRDVQDCNVLVNSVCPGWVRTDMGGASAERSLEEGARGIVWAATLPEDGPSGGFFRDGKAVDW